MPSAGKDLNDYILFLTSRVNGIDKFIDGVVRQNKGEILKTLKLRLWNKGTDGDGVKIQTKIPADKQEASRKYRYKKKRRGYRSEPTNLRVHGDFYRSFRVFSIGGFIEIDSLDNPDKVKRLFAKFGENILSLTEEEQERFVEDFIRKEVINWLQSNTEFTIIEL